MFFRSMTSAALFAALFAGAAASAQSSPASMTLERMKKLDDANREKFGGDANYLVLPGLVANKAARRVTLNALGTGLSADDPVEFWFTSLSSGKDYEALAVTPVLPSDVHKALEFIGLKPGRPVNYNTNNQWPRGPRVVVTFGFRDAQEKQQNIRAEDMIAVMPDRKPLPKTGLMFVGSYRYKDEAGVEHYAADMLDSRAIAPNYNDPSAVLDVPQRSSQAAVYGSQRGSDQHPIPAGAAVTIALEPADSTLADRTRDLAIDATLLDGKPTFTVTATPPAGKAEVLGKPVNIAELLALLGEQVDGKTDVYVTVRPDADLPVTEVRKMYKLLSALEAQDGLRLDGPGEDHLYYRAFFPEEEWRRREDRLGEPWELRFVRNNGKVVASLARMVDDPDADRPGTQHEEKYDVASADQLVKLLNSNLSQWTKVILVYPPADLAYGELMGYVRPALATFPRVFVFTPEGDPSTQPTTKPVE